jgi:ribosome maturation protein SDO1
MAQTTARIKKAGKNFEIIVDLDEAVKLKKNEIENISPEGDIIFTDSKKGFKASPSDLGSLFGTSDVNEVAKKIIQEGEILLTQDYRDEKKEKKQKQIVEFLSKNTVEPQTGNPIPFERIKNVLEEAKINIKDSPIETQIKDIMEKISKIIPIKLETKKIKLVIPAIFSGKVYNIINPYKLKENWNNDGSLEVLLEIPSGIIIDFYDNLNSITHGSVVSEEIKDD